MADNLVMIGFKSCGKSTVGRLVASLTTLSFVDLDDVIEANWLEETGENLSCRDIYIQHGASAFRKAETAAIVGLDGQAGILLSTGGGAPMEPVNRPLLGAIGEIVYLYATPDVLAGRFEANSWPAFLQKDPTVAGLEALWQERHHVYSSIADLTIEVGCRTPHEIAAEIYTAWQATH